MAYSPLLFQLVVILVTARVLAWFLRYLGQPPVIGGWQFTLLRMMALGTTIITAPALHLLHRGPSQCNLPTFKQGALK